MARIYVVDDKKEVGHVSVRMLGIFGYDVSQFQSANEVLEAIAEGGRPDLVLTDVDMPDMNGLELCRRLKDGQDIKVITYSGNPYEQESKEAGADAHLKKPILMEDLENKTRELLGE